jgi:hypothetical protein
MNDQPSRIWPAAAPFRRLLVMGPLSVVRCGGTRAAVRINFVAAAQPPTAQN